MSRYMRAGVDMYIGNVLHILVNQCNLSSTLLLSCIKIKRSAELDISFDKSHLTKGQVIQYWI